MRFLFSSVGKKYVVGITGLIWSLFVMQHMIGNMLIFAGPEAYNSYAHAIVSNKLILYGGEAVLLSSFLVHMAFALMINLENRGARSSRYAMTPSGEKAASLASRTMVQTGLVILAFTIYHLITFKWGPVYYATYGGVEMRDLHRLIIEVFQNPFYVGGYVVCLLVIGLHLSHGVHSMFKSWGFNHPKYTPCLETIAKVYAAVVAAGFIAQPLYAMMQR